MRRRLYWALLGLGPLLAATCTTIGSIGSLGGEGGGAGGSADVTATATTVTASSSAASSTSSGDTLRIAILDKVDLLLGIDDSPAMADKQQVLSLVLTDLIQGLVDPPCLDAVAQAVPNQPASGLDPCPAGSTRQFAPVLDLHLGVVTSSLGGHGADACSSVAPGGCPGGAVNASTDDHGHLVTRTSPCAGAVVASYQNEGFLAWDPAQTDVPPGQSDGTAYAVGAEDLVTGAGQIGCAYGSQLESWYRFLVDPAPYQSISVVGGLAVQSGVDAALLTQRGSFLRPDSLVAILMLSDADDCSIRESGGYYLDAQLGDPADAGAPYHLPRPRAECATNPDDPCCRSCGAVQTGCPPDPTCASGPALDDVTDNHGLRCWNTKQRFGVDFLYPTSRYVTGLTSATVPDQAGVMLANPLYPSGDGGALRDPSMVLLAGIVGVPWQDLARDPTDLTLGYKNAAELAAATGGVTPWNVILGDPASSVAPLDPHMIASPSPRTGTDPLTGVTLAPATADAGADPINGHEYTQSVPADLQYACIFPLVAARDCTDPSFTSCDCTDPANDNPLCAPDPSKGGQHTLQVRAKAYPALRQLQVLEALGSQGVTASVCPAQLANATRADYAYRPALQALLDRVAARLTGP